MCASILPVISATEAKGKKSLIWSGLSFAASALLNFGTLFILTQHLDPQGMAITFTSIIFQDLALLFMDSGMGSYVIQSDNLGQKEHSSLFYQSLITAGILTLLLLLFAPLISLFLNTSQAEMALSITALSFIPIGISFPQKQLLQKKHHFKRIAIAEFVGMSLASLVTIWLLFSGHGFVSYLYGFIARKTGESILLWLKEPWLPKPVLLKAQISKLFQYSFFASNALILSYGTRLVDTLLVGHILGSQSLGLYALASNLVFFPVSKCVLSFSRVVIVDLSRNKSDINALREAYLKALLKVSVMLFPVLTALVILAPEVVRFFFNPRWYPMIPLIQIMALNGLVIIFLRMSEPLLLALSKVRTVFLVYGINIILTIAFLLGFLRFGTQGAAWAVVFAGILPCYLMYRALKVIGIVTIQDILHKFRFLFLFTLVMVLMIGSVRILQFDPFITLVISSMLVFSGHALCWKRLTGRIEGE